MPDETLDLFGRNRWLRFGLSTNPYFVEALSSADEGPRPISLFQGRSEQGRQLASTIASEESSLCLVEAPSGVGKSTFVNYVKHRLRERYFAPPVEVGVQSNWTAQHVVLGAVDAIVRHASDVHPQKKWSEREFPAISRARELVMTVQRAGWSPNLGISLFGAGPSIGVSPTVSTQPPLLGPVLSPAFLEEVVREARTLSLPPTEGVILHVNNLDTLLASSPRSARTLISDLRDFFGVSGTHWVLVGPPGLRSNAIAPERRVLTFVKETVELDKLPLGDVEKLLEKRYRHYKTRPKWTEPTAPELISKLYREFGGDLRGMLNALSVSHRFYDPVDIRPMPHEFGLGTLSAFYRRRLEASLAPKTHAVLAHLVDLRRDEFTQDDAASIERHQSNRSRRFAELEQEDAVRLLRSEGPRKIYTLGGASGLAFHGR